MDGIQRVQGERWHIHAWDLHLPLSVYCIAISYKSLLSQKLRYILRNIAIFYFCSVILSSPWPLYCGFYRILPSTSFGMLLRMLSRGRLCQFPEEMPGFQLPPEYFKDTGSSAITSASVNCLEKSNNEGIHVPNPSLVGNILESSIPEALASWNRGE